MLFTPAHAKTALALSACQSAAGSNQLRVVLPCSARPKLIEEAPPAPAEGQAPMCAWLAAGTRFNVSVRLARPLWEPWQPPAQPSRQLTDLFQPRPEPGAPAAPLAADRLRAKVSLSFKPPKCSSTVAVVSIWGFSMHCECGQCVPGCISSLAQDSSHLTKGTRSILSCCVSHRFKRLRTSWLASMFSKHAAQTAVVAAAI